MNVNFKPLGLAAAVAAVAAGYSGVTSAQATYTSAGLGDLAIVPYYTTVGEYVTGVHIINTSESTQVVKLRFRRGSDSMDAMDINLILSPKDEWTGYVDDSSGRVVLATDDNSCTAPLPVNGDGQWIMPTLYAAGATEGYIEVIGMGQTIDEDQPIAQAAVHVDGVPVDCGLVASNFFRNATTGLPTSDADLTKKGVISSNTTHQTCSDDILGIPGQTCAGDPVKSIDPTPVLPNTFRSTDNVLKVSFFVRDANGGLEFGGNAVNLSDFSDTAMMSNQQKIVVGEADAYGYLFPDLDGGSPADPLTFARGLYEDIRSELGVTAVINDWSVASARNVSTDWVVTLPGQYLMVDLLQYTTSLFDSEEPCLSLEAAAKYNGTIPAPTVPAEQCDARDIPVLVLDSSETYDREEGTPTFTNPEDGLVISPEVGVLPPTAITLLEYEVNVLEWVSGSDAEANPVLTSQYAKTVDVTAWEADYGWASLSIESDTEKTQGIYNFAASAQAEAPVFDSTTSNVPMVGFVAWERSFPSNPGANYGRLVEHSYITSN